MLADVGNEHYLKLVEVYAKLVVVGEKLMKKHANSMRELSAPGKQRAILQDEHTSSGHVGIPKFNHMIRYIYSLRYLSS